MRTNPAKFDVRLARELHAEGHQDAHAAAVFYDYIADRLALPGWMDVDALYDAIESQRGFRTDDRPSLRLGVLQARIATALSPVRDLTQLTEDVGLPTPEEYIDELDRFESGAYSYIYKEALEEGATEDEAEEAAQKAEMEERDEAYVRYYDAVMYVLGDPLAELHLMLVPLANADKTHPHEFVVRPTQTWRDSARAVMAVIEGVGYFEYNSDLATFLDSGPYTPRGAVLQHLHTLGQYWAVYGSSAKTVFERYLQGRS